jgi:CarD family transcriptional regulator
MDFTNGDYVVHPKHGLGTIETVEEMKFTGSSPSMFYRVSFPNTTVWIPVSIERPGGSLRPVTSRQELSSYRKILKSLPAQLEDDFRKRQTELEARLVSGSFRALCEVVRDLSAREAAKNLNNFDANLLRQTRQSLEQEWAAASGCTSKDAAAEIDQLLKKTVQ